jgi:hypothetical protein
MLTDQFQFPFGQKSLHQLCELLFHTSLSQFNQLISRVSTCHAVVQIELFSFSSPPCSEFHSESQDLQDYRKHCHSHLRKGYITASIFCSQILNHQLPQCFELFSTLFCMFLDKCFVW